MLCRSQCAAMLCWCTLRPSLNTTDPSRRPIRFDPTPAQTDQRDPSRSAWPFMFRDYLLLLVYAVIFVCFTNIATQFNKLVSPERTARKNYTNHISTSFLPNFLSTSKSFKMSGSEKQEAVSSAAGNEPTNIEEEEDTTVYPKGIQFVMLMASFYLGVFMVSLVRRINLSGTNVNPREGTTF